MQELRKIRTMLPHSPPPACRCSVNRRPSSTCQASNHDATGGLLRRLRLIVHLAVLSAMLAEFAIVPGAAFAIPPDVPAAAAYQSDDSGLRTQLAEKFKPVVSLRQ